VSSGWAPSTIRCAMNCSRPNAAKGQVERAQPAGLASDGAAAQSARDRLSLRRLVNPRNNLEYFGRFSKLTRAYAGWARALDLGYVAAGRVDGYWELSIKPWDVAAGA